MRLNDSNRIQSNLLENNGHGGHDNGSKDFAFLYRDSLTGITIPDSVTSIGKGAFFHCDSLISVTLPKSLKEVKTVAFYGCSKLTRVMVPTSVKRISRHAFYSCPHVALSWYGADMESVFIMCAAFLP